MEGICQMQCCLVQRQIVDCGPEVQNVARPRAFGMETPEDVFAQVDGKVPFPIPGRIVQRTRTSTLFVTSQAIQISEMGQDLLDRNLFAQVCVVHRPNRSLIDRRGRGGYADIGCGDHFFSRENIPRVARGRFCLGPHPRSVACRIGFGR